MKPRTSHSHPLEIAALDTPGDGRIGMTFCPGKQDPFAMTGAWARDLDTDLAVIRSWGASALVTLMEQYELVHLRVGHLGEAVRSLGLDWYHLPIQDVSVPSREFEAAWSTSGEELRRRLLDGQSLVVHCRGGLGRTEQYRHHLRAFRIKISGQDAKARRVSRRPPRLCGNYRLARPERWSRYRGTGTSLRSEPLRG